MEREYLPEFKRRRILEFACTIFEEESNIKIINRGHRYLSDCDDRDLAYGEDMSDCDELEEEY